MQSNINDKLILRQLRSGDQKAFRALFDQYYKYLVVTVYNVLGDGEKAKDIAHDVFLQVWKKREHLDIQASFRPYLRQAAINKTLNYIKSQRFDFTEPEDFPVQESPEAGAQELLEGQDLQELINATIEQLPKKCQQIFILCRLEHMSHKEIAAKLGISTKTVENQMTKALKILRNAVAPYVKGEI